MKIVTPTIVIIFAISACAQINQVCVNSQNRTVVQPQPSNWCQVDRSIESSTPAANSPTPLMPDEIRSIRVFADQPSNHSGIALEKGRSYHFCLTPLNYWIDLDVIGHPIEGWGREELKLHQKIVRWFGRRRSPSPDHDLMVLMGAVSNRQENLFAFRDHLDCETYSESAAAGTFTAPASGELILFANDAPGYYGNNCGYVILSLLLDAPSN